MTDDINRVREELEQQGLPTTVRDSRQGKVVQFDYLVDVGPRKGEKFKVGVSFQEGDILSTHPTGFTSARQLKMALVGW